MQCFFGYQLRLRYYLIESRDLIVVDLESSLSNFSKYAFLNFNELSLSLSLCSLLIIIRVEIIITSVTSVCSIDQLFADQDTTLLTPRAGPSSCIRLLL